MSVLATETQKYSNTVKKEQWADIGWCREKATASEATAKTYKIGDVVGMVTATSKVKLAVETAVDGFKVFYGIVLEDITVPANTDTKVLLLVNGDAALNKAAVFLDATYDNDTKKNVVYAAMAAKGIKLFEAV